MRYPILRGPKEYVSGDTRYRLAAQGGLHYIRGNSAPHFSLTAMQDREHAGQWAEDCGGCCHDLILAHWPELADLAAMHLSDMDGAPMHAEGNGWYALAGALGGFGQRYHAGNSPRNFPLPEGKMDPARPWMTTEHRNPTPAECLQQFAEHCRVPLEEAATIAEAVRAELGQPDEGEGRPPHNKADYARARAVWTRACESMRPRWKKEADACIARHGLRVYGDDWKGGRP